MKKHVLKLSEKSGLPPGVLVHVGHPRSAETRLSMYHYTEDHLDELGSCSMDDIRQASFDTGVTWIRVEGLSQVAVIEQLGTHFGIHRLVLEDILNTRQRPKFEEYDDYLYIVLKAMTPDKEPFAVTHEQVSVVVFSNLVITFSEGNDACLDGVLQQIRTSKGRFRSQGSDYLTYAILDAIVDTCFTVTDCLDETLEVLEDRVMAGDDHDNPLADIQSLKREIMAIRRHVSPLRDLLTGIFRTESAIISDKTHVYFRDVSDHATRVIESMESYREILSGILDIYMSSVSNRMNEVMKVLTIFASIFTPLTFIAGIYGMNFEHMPELKWKWAYPAVWLIFILVPLVLLRFFRRKKWL
jgi:magnesium transporter